MLRKLSVLVCLMVLFVAPAWAKPPVTFSFASDDEPDGPTFLGSGTSISAKVKVDLMVDTSGDLGGGIVIFPSELFFGAELDKYEVFPRGSNYLHVWKARGRFDFIHDTALAFTPLLTSGFVEATLTSISPDPDRLGETITLQGSESVDSFMVLLPQNHLEAILNAFYPPNYLEIGEDFAFTFTSLRIQDSVGRPKLKEDGSFADPWTSEGSFSASGGGD